MGNRTVIFKCDWFITRDLFSPDHPNTSLAYFSRTSAHNVNNKRKLAQTQNPLQNSRDLMMRIK